MQWQLLVNGKLHKANYIFKNGSSEMLFLSGCVLKMNYLYQVQQPVHKVDSTSFVYTHTKEPVPLADYFLNFRYLDSNHLKTNASASGKLSTEIIEKSSDTKSGVTLQYTDWILFILIGLFSLVAFVRITGKNYLHRVFTSVVNYSYSNSFFIASRNW